MKLLQATTYLVIIGSASATLPSSRLLRGQERSASSDISPSSTDDGDAVYFEFQDAHGDSFVIALMDPLKITQARNIISTKSGEHVSGYVLPHKASYNPAWDFELMPDSIEFFEFSTEVCDASIAYVNDHLTTVGTDFLPGNHWCPWSSELVREIGTTTQDDTHSTTSEDLPSIRFDFLTTQAEAEEYVVDSEDKFNAFIAQPASGNTNSLQCTWQSSLEQTSNHKQACQSLKNGFTVPYTCDGNHKNICCTVSNIVKPTFDRFGTCSKNGVAANPNVPAPVPSPAAPKPAGGDDSLTPLKCNWSRTFASFTNHKQACMAANDEYTVPYTCDGEYTNICCTVSGITNPTFDNKKFGTCLKNGTTSKPTSKPTTRKTGYNVAVAVE
jgi:hypothetical protein